MYNVVFLCFFLLIFLYCCIQFADDELPTELPPQPAKRDKNDEATGGGNIDYSITTA